jgi:hydroxypyruvate reductase/glycerate 2-kinase
MKPSTQSRKKLEVIWGKGVKAVDSRDLVAHFVQSDASFQSVLSEAASVLVVGGGKASAAMALGLEQEIKPFLSKTVGILNVPEANYPKLEKIKLNLARPAGMNQPTAKAVEGSKSMIQLAQEAKEGDLLLALISGGGSALMPLPSSGVSLEDKQKVTSLLSGTSASINELNCVRKHLSQIKGGRLAQAFLEATQGKGKIVTLILSDVIEDKLDVIGSGPTVNDPTTFKDAFSILEKHLLLDKTPASILQHLQSGIAGKISDTPKDLPASIRNKVLGNNALALDAAANQARQLGYQVINLGSCMEGDTAGLASIHASIARSILKYDQPSQAPVCILSGGETTVNLGQNPGKGGRNQEMALAFLCALKDHNLERITFLAAGTDGEDGPTDAAGAFADSNTLKQSGTMNASDFLARHDAYYYFKTAGSLFQPGPTGTNVMDLRVLIVE